MPSRRSAWLLVWAACGCAPKQARSDPSPPPDAGSVAPSREAGAAQPTREPRIIRWAWRPPGGSDAAYEMPDPDDQHRMVLTPGVHGGEAYPVVIALHGQPKRGQRPASYAFPRTVTGIAVDLVTRGEVPPIVLVAPVFRFLGGNWPAFDLVAFRREVEGRLAAEGVRAGAFYVVGHSGAAGCGGDGLNRAHRIHPRAVGFFDTCLGAGWRDEIAALRAEHVATLVVHSVETAGFVPRQAREYLADFDFGRPYAAVGLLPGPCPAHLPDVPLRAPPFRCSADKDGVVRALVIDTGEGETAHEAVVPEALAYFLREYLGPH